MNVVTVGALLVGALGVRRGVKDFASTFPAYGWESWFSLAVTRMVAVALVLASVFVGAAGVMSQ